MESSGNEHQMQKSLRKILHYSSKGNVFYISDVAALLLVVFMHWQTAHFFPPAFTEPATPSSCQDNSLGLEPGLPWVGSLSAEMKTEQAGTNHPTTPQTKSVQAQYHRYSVLWDKGMAQCFGEHGSQNSILHESPLQSPDVFLFMTRRLMFSASHIL